MRRPARIDSLILLPQHLNLSRAWSYGPPPNPYPHEHQRKGRAPNERCPCLGAGCGRIQKGRRHRKAAEALEMAAMAWEDAEKAHPIGFIKAIAREHARNEAERIRRIRLDPREPRIGDN